jgi:hypothetical protein
MAVQLVQTLLFYLLSLLTYLFSLCKILQGRYFRCLRTCLV